MAWSPDLPSALREAGDSGRLVLAYIGLNPTWCPLCAHLEQRVFEQPESHGIHEVCVPVKILYDAHATGEARAFFRRHRVRSTPMLLILTPEGEQLHRQVADLFPLSALGRDGGASNAGLLGVEDILELVAEARRRDLADRRRMAALEARADVTARLELVRILCSRAQWTQAIAVLEGAAQATPGVDVEEQAIDVLLEMGREEAAAARLRGLLEDEGGHARAPRWRLRLLALTERGRTQPPTPHEVGVQGNLLRGIVREAAESGDEVLEALGRLALAEMLQRAGGGEPMRQELLWFDRGMARRSPLRRMPAEALLRLVTLQRMAQATEAAEATEAWLRRLHPSSVEYQRATHGTLVVPIAAPARPSR